MTYFSLSGWEIKGTHTKLEWDAQRREQTVDRAMHEFWVRAERRIDASLALIMASMLWLVGGIVCCVWALFVANIFWSALLGVTGASLLWGIGELFEQVKRVEKGWFPMNPKRKDAYKREE